MRADEDTGDYVKQIKMDALRALAGRLIRLFLSLASGILFGRRLFSGRTFSGCRSLGLAHGLFAGCGR
jgi:hypothetical protein